jgi:hypothetical protein
MCCRMSVVFRGVQQNSMCRATQRCTYVDMSQSYQESEWELALALLGMASGIPFKTRLLLFPSQLGR